MQKLHLLAAVAFAASAVAAPTAPSQPLPLVVEGPIVIDSADLEGNLLRVPEKMRDQVRTRHEAISSIVDQMFIARSLAAKARELGMDKDPRVSKRMEQVQDGVLADLYVQKLEKEAVPPALEQRARELYLANASQFMTQEEVHLQHILVNLWGRTREMGLARAQEAYAAVKGGEDFLAVAARYSDDSTKKNNKGDLGYNSPTSFVDPVRKAIDGLKQKGEIAGPIESEQGFHIVRLVDRKPARQRTYEEVGKKILESEEERLRKARVQQVQDQIRASKTVVVHTDNLKKMMLSVDPQEVARKAAEGSAAK